MVSPSPASSSCHGSVTSSRSRSPSLFINKWTFSFPQAYTQSGGKRPFGVSILYMGWDKHFGYQLVMVNRTWCLCKQYDLQHCFAVPVRPLWQLWWMEGNLHWQQLECCCVHVETGVQGATQSQVILCEVDWLHAWFSIARQYAHFKFFTTYSFLGGWDQPTGCSWPQY